MAAIVPSISCRVCCRIDLHTHTVALFSGEQKSSRFSDRLSKVLDIPVERDDGLSPYICRPCNRKFLSAEAFIALAKSNYDKSSRSQSGSHTQPASRRSKDTSGVGVSPDTHTARPSAKRQTIGVFGRRLTFPVQNESKKISLLR